MAFKPETSASTWNACGSANATSWTASVMAVKHAPQLGRIGLTEAEARAQNRKIRIAKMPMSYVARALEVDETRGFMKAVVDAGTGQILGATVLGLEGGEIMSMLQLAMMGKLTYTNLRDAVFAHPALAESLNNLFTHFES